MKTLQLINELRIQISIMRINKINGSDKHFLFTLPAKYMFKARLLSHKGWAVKLNQNDLDWAVFGVFRRQN